ncbi:MAG TPA: penicillin acylase family protein [Chitinophagaceae bacterium]|nr:penicillin acylase family protein [Chitinophagaceae bacterium]
MKFLVIIFLFSALCCTAQIDPSRITIARDSFGVPHIFAPTDPEVAYGLAWAHAEDDFATLQLVVLSGKARLGSALGRKGAEADYVIDLLRCRELVNEQWDTLSPDFLALIRGYVAGLNAYAKAHPQEVKYKNAFPFDEKEYMTAVVFSVAIFCGVDQALPQILGGNIATIPGFASQGSNAFAFHPSKTVSGEAFLAINAHQPLEGPTAFYEAHVQSEQGWNMLGGLLAGGCVILHGTNENLGWAHTVNYPDKIDIYQLEMNPANANEYKFDGKWIALEERKARLHVKGIPVTIGKKLYWSKYGATVKTKQGVFSLRLPATMDIRVMEEWYRMNKARNFTEFYAALSMTALPMFNIVYADRRDTIFYISNAKLPRRNPSAEYHWRNTLPGNTSATLWTEFKQEKELPQYINPAAGYLFNTNHSPFLATAPGDNLDPGKFDPNDGFERYHNNRSERVTELLRGVDKIDFETFKRIKFDQQLPKQLKYPYGIDTMLAMKASSYPALGEIITSLQDWDRKATANSKGAAVFLLAYDHVSIRMAGRAPRQLTLPESIETYQYIHDYMLKYFQRTDLVLGDIQKLVRGDDARPAWGLPDVLTAAYTTPYKNGQRKVISGDAYICFVRYPKTGLPIIESVNTFGASSNPSSPHYKDQMTLFQNQQTKHMTLDKDEVMRTAERTYHPGGN